MGKFDQRTYEIIRRLQNARLSLLSKHPFYALLLLHMKFALDITCETAYTDGERIAFNPDFMDALSDKELEFVLMHEVLHAALAHPFRHQSDYDQECFDKACDIVVNSNILYSFGMDIKRITLKRFGTAMHLAPDGKEGYQYTVEQIYDQLLYASANRKKKKSKKSKGGGGKRGSDPGNANGSNGGGDDAEDANANAPSTDGGSGGQEQGQADGSEGEVSQDALNALIASLLQSRATHGKIDPAAERTDSTDSASPDNGTIDDHSFWNGDEDNHIGRDTWLQRMIDATDLIASTEGGNGRGTIPLAAQRIVSELKNPKLDWRTILNDFVQEEINDYSFSPPDRRMEDSPFFLPDFNEKDERVKDILFMVDTSGSMSTDDVTECYSEICGAIRQFNGKLQGKLGFFDAVVVEPIPFEDEEEFKIIRPVGGGGTSFDVIFDYVEKKMGDEPPVSIVILTDGYAPFPEESRAGGIPVLWIINNEEQTPPWGKIARLHTKDVP